MSLDRRRFILAGALLAAGLAPRHGRARGAATGSIASAPSSDSTDSILDAGPLDAYRELRVYDDFRERGFFVIRRPGSLFVLSSVCTHKGCKVRAQEDGSFACRCHGSKFSPDGKVIKGPASKDLPRLGVDLDESHHVLVNLGVRIKPATTERTS